MKGFHRSNLIFSLCGLNCGLCPMRIDGHCPGCGGGKGNQSCSIAKCSLRHDKVEYCFLCPEYPCDRYEGIEEYDSFISHQRQMQDVVKAKKIGINAYNEEQNKKINVLNKLLSEYNDGRKKTFYYVAVNLLPIHYIENIIEQITNSPSYYDLTLKEKAEQIASQIQDIAFGQGVILKLRRKKK